MILPEGDRIAYTALAAEAALLEPVSNVTLKDPSQWRLLGKPGMKRLDMVSKCTGTEVYGIDYAVEGMVYAAVRANPGIGGEVIAFDASGAEAMRGVHKVMAVEHGVAVIADNTWRAFRAVNAIDITWGAATYPASSEEIFAVLDATVNDETRLDHRQRDDGDVDTALNSGEVIEADYRVPYLAHAPLEPMNAIVMVTADACTIWTGTQIPIFIRNMAARTTGLDREQIQVHVQPIGGSFGHRLEMTHVEQAVELAMAMPGTPIKLTWSREEDMAHDYPRPAAVARARGKVVNARVDSFDLSVGQCAMTPNWFGRLSGLPIPGPDATITTGSWDQPFAIANYRVSGYRAPDMVPVSSWRAVGASANGFFHDCFLDELIHAAGADPLQERLRLCLDESSRKVLETLGELSDWQGPERGENGGRGVAFCLSFGVPVAQVIDVTRTESGIRIDKVFAVVDTGIVLDPDNLEAQVYGGIIYGLSHGIYGELTYENHAPQQRNYHQYRSLRLYQTPEITVRALSNSSRIRGIGEPGLPPAAPALANAIFAATGQRIRELPLYRHVDFV